MVKIGTLARTVKCESSKSHKSSGRKGQTRRAANPGKPKSPLTLNGVQITSSAQYDRVLNRLRKSDEIVRDSRLGRLVKEHEFPALVEFLALYEKRCEAINAELPVVNRHTLRCYVSRFESPEEYRWRRGQQRRDYWLGKDRPEVMFTATSYAGVNGWMDCGDGVLIEQFALQLAQSAALLKGTSKMLRDAMAKSRRKWVELPTFDEFLAQRAKGKRGVA